jgi:hypothetical protein
VLNQQAGMNRLVVNALLAVLLDDVQEVVGVELLDGAVHALERLIYGHRADRHRHQAGALHQSRSQAARRRQKRTRGFDALHRAVRRAGCRLPRKRAARRRAQAHCGGSLQLLRLAQIHRLRWRLHLYRPLRRFGTWPGLP